MTGVQTCALPISLLLDVLEIVAGVALRRIFLAHVAEPTRELGETLTVGTLAEPGDRKMGRLGEDGSGQERESGFGKVQGRGGWPGR